MANDNEKPLWEVTSTDGENRAKIALTVGSTKDVDIEGDKEIQFVPGGNLRPATKEAIADQMDAITASFERTNDYLRQVANAASSGALTATQPKKRSFLKRAAGFLKAAWDLPQIQSVALTWLARTGLGATGAGIVVALVSSLVGSFS